MIPDACELVGDPRPDAASASVERVDPLGEGTEEDEVVEVTPTLVRLRKIMLMESDRRRAARRAES